jgi:hypothetical protein
MSIPWILFLEESFHKEEKKNLKIIIIIIGCTLKHVKKL